MRKVLCGVLIGILLTAAFSAPWVYAVGSCAVFRTWNTGDTITAADLNSSFTTAAVTNSTLSCLDDFSATVSQMQSTADPYASGTESQATSAAGEIERLRFMFKQIFGLTQWYRHDQAPTFSFSHMNAQALHLSSTGVPGGTDTQQNAFLARFPVLTGPDHWTGIWWPHNTAHMAFSFRDANHAQGGVQGGIELFRWHASGVVFHHTVALMFKHSESGMHGGQRGHVTALSIDPTTDQLILGHPGATMRVAGTGITGQGGTSKALFLSSAGHVYVNTISASGTGGLTIFLKPQTATMPSALFPALVRHSGTNITNYGLMYHAALTQAAHWTAVIPAGMTPTSGTIEIWSHQSAQTTGTIGWHVGIRVLAHAGAWDGAFTVHNVYPQAVNGTAGSVTRQTEAVTNSLAGARLIQIYVQKNSASTVTEAAQFDLGVIFLQ